MCIFNIQGCQFAMIRCTVDMPPISIRCALLILCELLHILVKTPAILFFKFFFIALLIFIFQIASYKNTGSYFLVYNYIIKPLKHLLYMYSWYMSYYLLGHSRLSLY